MAVPALQSRIGSVVGDRYKILSVLGQGGMGVLYTAEHVMTKRRVALKVVRVDPDSDTSGQADATARFLAEARHAAAVSHPNIVDVLDMGVDEAGAPFLVMELLVGTSLDRYLAEHGRLSPAQTLSLLIPVLGALATLHDAGIVHRDVKTSNIFLRTTPRGAFEPKLLDFGLAHSANDVRITRSGLVMGTPMYMAPEQASGAAVGPAADVWSLGVVMFECLSGTLPFNGRDRNALAAQVLAGHVLALSKAAPEVPTPLSYAVERALRIDLSLRYASTRDFAHGLVLAARACHVELPKDPDPIGLADFEDWRVGNDLAPTTRTVPALRPEASAPIQSSMPASTPATASPASRPMSPTRQRGARGALVALTLLLALGGIAAWIRNLGAVTTPSPNSAVVPSSSARAPAPVSDGQQGPSLPAARAPNADARVDMHTNRPLAPAPDASTATEGHARPAPIAPTSPSSRKSARTRARVEKPASETATQFKPESSDAPPPSGGPGAPAPAREDALHMESDWR